MTTPERRPQRQAAADLKQAAMDRLSPVALTTPEGRLKEIPWAERLSVGQHQVRQAMDCPRRAAVIDDDDFEWSPLFATRRLSKAAMSRALDEGLTSWEPLDLLRAEAQRIGASSSPDHFEQWFQQASKAVRAQAVTHAAAHMTKLITALGIPLPANLRIGADNRDHWTFPDRGLQLKGRPDATSGRVRGSVDERSVMILVGSDNETARAIVAFEAVCATLSVGSRPAEITLVAAQSGLIDAAGVDEALLREGLDVAVRTAEVVAAGRSAGVEQLERRPGFFTCRGCPLVAQCEAHQRWAAAEPAARGGLPVF